MTAHSRVDSVVYDAPWGGNVVGDYHLLPYDQFGNQATWTWTLTFGTANVGGVDVPIYGPDPGPPFKAYDETYHSGAEPYPTPAPQPYLPDNSSYPQPAPGTWQQPPVGSSIPGVTGMPAIGLARVDPPQKIVSGSADKVNWGLFTFQDRTPYSAPDPVTGKPTVGNYCADPSGTAKNYELIQHVNPDGGKVDQIVSALDLVYYGGIYSAGGTPSKEGLRRAAEDVRTETFLKDRLVPLNCDRPYGMIFCTDGLSNICNPAGDPSDPTGPPGPDSWTGYSGGEPWTSPCEGYLGVDKGCYTPVEVPVGSGTYRLLRCCDPGSKQKGSGYDCETNSMLDPKAAAGNPALIDTYKTATGVPPGAGTPDGFVAGIAETLFSDGFKDKDGVTKARVRTFVIGISQNVGKCELNYTAYRGRTDASAQNGDAGYDYEVISGDPGSGDPRLPQNGEDGTTPNTYGKSVGSGDYAFFANDSQSISRAFQEIIASTALGDYATSPPIAGAAIAQGNIVLLPSTEYPKWKGRLRAIDTQKDPTDPAYYRWDAGCILSDPKCIYGYQAPADRKLYTWDPANLAAGLIEIKADNSTRDILAAIAGLPNTKFTTNVIDFIRGNDGTLKDVPRAWVYGASINSTPAVVGNPETFYQDPLAKTHAAFELKHRKRRPLAWVGSDDGMLHAFDFNTGFEVIALMPPELLARQYSLYQNFLTIVNPITKEKRAPNGQEVDLNKHIWGVAQSFRYADVYDTKASPPTWKTVGYLTLGPSGDSITAIDVTHPSPSDDGNDPTQPVQILWRKSSADLTGLGQTWSVPAVAAIEATAPEKFLLIMGAGFNAASTATAQKDSKLFQLNAVDGTDGYSTGNNNWVPVKVAPPISGNEPLVGQQAFASSVFFDTTKPTFYGDNVANLGLQADLNGRVWFNYATGGTTDFDKVMLGMDVPDLINTLEGAPDQAPLYYPPAASGRGNTGCQAYAFGSGTEYEKSPLETDPTGAAATSGKKSDYAWKPRIFIATNADALPGFNKVDASGGAVQAQILSAIELPPCDLLKNPNGPRCKLSMSDPTTFGPRTQLTAPPFLVVPLSGDGTYRALFLVYDPDAIGFCRGYSYIVLWKFDLSACGVPTNGVIETYEGGEGAGAGFAMAGSKIIIAKSGHGTGQKAGLQDTGVNISDWGGPANARPVYWKELQ
ncbi:MAG TPA: PilC/PilY family type IV pilus protein [Thermoanaerobaculia bacterium]|nr:PilC/PilY family type IV pilus protein [Thermoanaerobaculia bacterium]